MLVCQHCIVACSYYLIIAFPVASFFLQLPVSVAVGAIEDLVTMGVHMFTCSHVNPVMLWSGIVASMWA